MFDSNVQDSFSAFESAIIGGSSGNLTTAKKSAPIKSPEEIRAEWLQERRGLFTASEFHRLMTYQNRDELPEGAKTYVLEKVVESLTVMDDSERFVTADMQWGIDHEVEAVIEFAGVTGELVSHVGDNQRFIKFGDHAGATPDGLIGEHSGIEVKCPKSKTHFNYLMMKSASDLKSVEPKYYWQIMGSMMVTGRNYWYFVSYDPRFHDKSKRLHIIKIERDEYEIVRLQDRMIMAVIYKKKLIGDFNG